MQLQPSKAAATVHVSGCGFGGLGAACLGHPPANYRRLCLFGFIYIVIMKGSTRGINNSKSNIVSAIVASTMLTLRIRMQMMQNILRRKSRRAPKACSPNLQKPLLRERVSLFTGPGLVFHVLSKVKHKVSRLKYPALICNSLVCNSLVCNSLICNSWRFFVVDVH